jgi:Vacuolar protein sorting-associated protein 26
MSSFFFSTPVDIDIVLEDTDERQSVDVKLDKNRREKAPLYMDGESVKGAVTIRPKDGRRLEHTGIKVQFIGVIGETESHARRGTLFNLCIIADTFFLFQRCFLTEEIITNSSLLARN